MDDQELADIYAFAMQLGKDAGDMLMKAAWDQVDGDPSGASSHGDFLEKDNSVEIVTKTDHGVYLDSQPQR